MKIAYKVIAVILALAIIPMVFLLPIATVRVQSTALQILSILGPIKNHPLMQEYLQNHDGKLPEYMGEDFSVEKIISLASGNDTEKLSKEVLSTIEPIISPMIILAVILVLLIICAIITAIFAIACKDNRKVIYSSMAGLGLSMMFKYAFGAVAAPFLDGRISLSSIFDKSWLSLIGKIDAFTLSSTFWFIPLVFGCIIIWTVLYNITLPESDKVERKLMLGEVE